MVCGCAVYLVFGELFPSDFYLSARSFKKNPNFVYQKDNFRTMISSKSFYREEFSIYYKEPERLFEGTSYLFSSHYKNTKVAVVTINGLHYVARKFQPDNLWAYLLQLPFKSSNALRAWYYGHMLSKLNINASKPVLMIEKRIGPFCFSSYLLSSYISGDKGDEYFQDSSPFKESWPEASSNLLKMLEKLSLSKIMHYNICLNNFIIKDNKPYLIDLEKLHKYPFSHKIHQKKHYNQYFSSIEKDLMESTLEGYNIFQEESLRINF